MEIIKKDTDKIRILIPLFLSFTVIFAGATTTDAMYVFSPEELQDIYINRLNFTFWTANHTDWIDDHNYTSTDYTDWFDGLKYYPIFNDEALSKTWGLNVENVFLV